eukprot:TRINITY_DN59084_c0_g1_i1.p1 TRINITY_DN59084_c0_g1~~TRINITY_DN59084_c0_g1_i1.p1  ORF type:complete len:127 (+),score=32.39 TRINITY_DN59084_c0_g1_i1:42-383(+)
MAVPAWERRLLFGKQMLEDRDAKLLGNDIVKPRQRWHCEQSTWEFLVEYGLEDKSEMKDRKQAAMTRSMSESGTICGRNARLQKRLPPFKPKVSEAPKFRIEPFNGGPGWGRS